MSSWDTVALGELCEILSGFAWSASNYNQDGRGVPIIRIQNVDSVTDNDFVYWDKPYDERFLIRLGDLLLTLSGSFRIALWSGPDALLNQRIIKLTPSSKLDRDWLLHVLRPRLGQIERLGKHALVNNVSLGDIRKIKIPLPPLAEQRRISTVLDAAKALREKRRQSLAKLDTLTRAIFLDFFGDPVRNTKCWDEASVLGDVAEIVSGVTKGRKLNGNRTRKIPYLAVINVQDRSLNLDLLKTIEATEDEIRRYKLQKGDLLLTEGGDPDKLGRGTLWNNELPECIHQNHIFRVRLTSSRLKPLFLNWLVGSQRGKKYFLKSAKQTTGIASINMTQLRRFPLIIPPLSLQSEFAEQVSAVDRLKNAQRTSLAKLEKLFASLQHRAFRGEL
jgi:type I restriction enzyme, S subunit